MRRRIALACFVIGLLLIGLNFLSLPMTDAFRPYLLYAGIALVLLGLVLGIAGRRSRDEVRPSREAPATEDVAVVLEPAAPVATPRADVVLVVGGNGASDSRVRWYHLAAATTTAVPARKAQIAVAVRGERNAEVWQWQTGDRSLDLTQTGARIPIVIGGVTESAEPLGSGWVVPFKNWYLTPNARSTLGPFLAPFIAGVRH
ncbi:MAG TPA: hypothetical protein VIP07_13335, partial [Candidatus Limnocylindria bacterium]